MKTTRFVTTIVAPAGLEIAKLTTMPIKKQHIEIIALEIITLLKLLKTRIELNAGKITRLDIIIAPIRRIPITIVREVRMAMALLKICVLMPVDVEKVSSKVIVKIEL